jgi:hypothetical protein
MDGTGSGVRVSVSFLTYTWCGRACQARYVRDPGDLVVDAAPSDVPTHVPPDAEHIRSELARHRLSREQVCSLIGMHVNQFSMYRTKRRKLAGWAAHNIGYGINVATGLPVFDVDMERGLLPPTSHGRHRRPRHPRETR